MALEAAGTEHCQAYGLTILRLLENFTHQTAVPGMVGILEDKRQLKRRIEMIARFKPSPYWSVPALALVVIIAAGCLTDAQTHGTSGQSQIKSGQSVNLPATNAPNVKGAQTLGSRPIPKRTGPGFAWRNLHVQLDNRSPNF
jgi:hypothetical protein